MKRKKNTKVKTVREDPVHAYSVRGALGTAIAEGRVVAAAEFKAHCLALMDEVRATGTEFVITKHNKPVARLVPVLEKAGSSFIGRARGTITVMGDIVAPTAPDWEEGADI